MKLAEIMHTDLVTALPNLPVSREAKLMVEKRVGCLPVTRASKLAGIVANTDFLKVLVNGSNC
ncbi:MAG: CBS domain-containing protein [SAR324 cluster bacterium]|nr:CBS domain-containing protein [SAR324 cluster bacterium]